ncbi:MAG: hypothetical protein CVU47_13060 [Chloroflexi bacterium HGW-Chloroflexi-9]|nr:MAG: hypothetical protein CVU47_13060 [Chloroflexi bacterium HGW-Chloroflexi-9]
MKDWEIACGVLVDEHGNPGWWCGVCGKQRTAGSTVAAASGLLDAHLASPLHRYHAGRIARGLRPWTTARPEGSRL